MKLGGRRWFQGQSHRDCDGWQLSWKGNAKSGRRRRKRVKLEREHRVRPWTAATRRAAEAAVVYRYTTINQSGGTASDPACVSAMA